MIWMVFGLFGLVLLAVLFGSGAASSRDVDQWMMLGKYGLLAVLVGIAILPSQGGFVRFARNALAWFVIILGLMTGYLYRDELADVGARFAADLRPGRPVDTPPLEGRERITLLRTGNGHFHAQGAVNGTQVQFLIDTGASVVVLTQRDAEAVGIDATTLNYDVPVSTANGTTTAARVQIANLAVGPIERNGVRAMVARPGALETSLLGMSFLSSLHSFEFRGNRLVLTD